MPRALAGCGATNTACLPRSSSRSTGAVVMTAAKPSAMSEVPPEMSGGPALPHSTSRVARDDSLSAPAVVRVTNERRRSCEFVVS